jgi:hypothetical protein
MKKAIILNLFFLYIGSLQSQVISTSDSMPAAGKLKYSLFDNAVILNKSENGIIYALPLDHMPVLRPDTTLSSQMPIYLFKKLPFNFFPSVPQVKREREKNAWKESLIQTPNGLKKIYKPINPPKLILPNRQ